MTSRSSVRISRSWDSESRRWCILHWRRSLGVGLSLVLVEVRACLVRRFNWPSNRLRSADCLAVACCRSLVDTLPTRTAVTAGLYIWVVDAGRRSRSLPTERRYPRSTGSSVAVTGRRRTCRTAQPPPESPLSDGPSNHRARSSRLRRHCYFSSP